jgi:hypothetical protein
MVDEGGNYKWEDPIIVDLEDVTQLCCIIGGCSGGSAAI